VFSGFATLAVDSVGGVRDRLSSMADGWGGYVESIQANTVVIRVPADRFREAFAAVLALGTVVDKRIESQDVTEALQDLAGRLQIARSTRERLYALLEATGDVKQRLSILQEIRRLTEQIEQISLTLETLQRLVDFSRITVELQSRLGEETRARQGIPFAWIAGLDPLAASTGRLRARMRLDLGPDFAVLGRERGVFRAESADGVRVRVGTVANRPRGDAAFWQNALAYHLGTLYRSGERLALGELTGVLFTSRDADPYTYFVAVAIRGGSLRVVEVLYPSRASLEKHRAALESALRAMEVR
jgi:hypothetical protein